MHFAESGHFKRQLDTNYNNEKLAAGRKMFQNSDFNLSKKSIEYNIPDSHSIFVVKNSKKGFFLRDIKIYIHIYFV